MPKKKLPLEVEWQGDAERTIALLTIVEAVRDGRLRARRADGRPAPVTHEAVARDPHAFEFHSGDMAALLRAIAETGEALPDSTEGQFAFFDMLTGLTRGEG